MKNDYFIQDFKKDLDLNLVSNGQTLFECGELPFYGIIDDLYEIYIDKNSVTVIEYPTSEKETLDVGIQKLQLSFQTALLLVNTLEVLDSFQLQTWVSGFLENSRTDTISYFPYP